MQVDQHIRELIAMGSMNEDTFADLERWQAEFEAGRLDPEDAAYIEALYAKLTGAPIPEPVDNSGILRIDGLDIEAWRKRALNAEAELAALRDQAREQTSPPA